MKSAKIPEATIIRLSVYSRYVNQLEKNGVVTVSSGDIAKGVSGSSAQVRKDLAYFGEFGTRGVGYNVQELNRQIVKILGLTNSWNVVIVGAGNLGSALCQYKGFQERGFNILAVFDNDIKKIGLTIGGVPIYPISSLEAYVKEEDIQIGIIAVPAGTAQNTVELLVDSGIKGILNFAPRVITAPDDVEVRNVDLAVNLELLTYNMALNHC